MSDATIIRPIHSSHDQHAHNSDHPLHSSRQPRWTQRATSFGVFGILALGAIYAGTSLIHDLMAMGPTTTLLPFILLGVALCIALGFEFVNGFHDTANAVATVIYTHSMAPQIAVVWSGIWNLIGVVSSAGLVAFTVVSLLPVELILQVGSSAGFAMVFALLIAAIIWNIGTWYFGIPNSSSHALIGSIIGVGLANQLMGGPNATSGVDWNQAVGVFRSLAFSPVVGFILSGLLLLLAKVALPFPKLYTAPEGSKPPPPWIRGLLILTCTGVSFFHGSNDGQKGMGLIMLILIGTVPTAYALNHAIGADHVQIFHQASQRAEAVLAKHANSTTNDDVRKDVLAALEQRTVTPASIPALNALVANIDTQVDEYGAYSQIPAAKTTNIRNDMYLASEMLSRISKDDQLQLSTAEQADLKAYKGELDNATKFIPTWVKIAVAIALGMGTMIGWRRIVVTVGEKIGKTHLTYGQGAAAEIIAMVTIGAADQWGWPVSTTHVLSSGVAGTMAANRSGLQWSTILNMIMAWVLTLPVAIMLSASLFWIFRQVF
ncbi:MAG TPA: inorganic phosphate transporter [Stellaceae bacterium]|jgi:PiT family inorganic phosphate transporter|nr:inorganic phosphate transporter [Stellaceae bacterium]